MESSLADTETMAATQLAQQEVADLSELLSSCLIFLDAEPDALAFAAASCEWQSFKKGEPIILENEANDSVYFIVRGKVEIVTYLSDDKRVQRLALLKEGSNFAEFSVLTKSARSGSAYAYTDCDVLRMPGAAFITLLRGFPGVAGNLVRNLARFNDKSLGHDEVIPYYNDQPIHLTPNIVEILPVNLWAKFGVIPTSLKSGLMSLLVKDPHNSTLFSHLSGGFSKLEFSVSIINEYQFNDVHQIAVESLKTGAPPAEKASAAALDPLSCLANSVLFGSFGPQEIQELLAYAQSLKLRAGEYLTKPGAAVDYYFLISKGSALVSRKIRGTTATAPVFSLEAGDGFGAAQVILNSASPCFVRAMDDMELIAIPKAVIEHLLSHPPFVIDFARVLAKSLQQLGHITGLKYLEKDDLVDLESVAELLPIVMIEEEHAIPLRLEDGEVTLGVVNPDSSGTLLRFGRYLLDYRIRLIGITEEQFQTWFRKMKAHLESATRPAPKLKPVAGDPKNEVLQWVEGILIAGLKSRASDIHFEPGPSGLTTRFRIDGVLREFGKKLPTELVPQAINRLKILSSMDIGDQHIAQDGHLEVQLGNVKIAARANALPVKHGEKIVLRLIRERNSVVPLDMIAPDRRIVNLLRTAADCRQGLFLVTGPTGSGKTTTLYSLLKAINHVGVNVISLEDPVEMEIGGINQVEINTKRGLDFASALRGILRQDPDVVMVGEIRDEVTSKTVFDAAVTGHLVLSTLHAGTSFDVVPRLKELGVSQAHIAEGLLGVVTQRLVRAVCKHCAEDCALTDKEREMFDRVESLVPPETVKRGAGCSKCGNSGYQGRLPLFEAWLTNRRISDAIRSGAGNVELQEIARETGFQSLYEFGLRMVQSGLTTPEELHRVLATVG